jgi:hypothetical protein
MSYSKYLRDNLQHSYTNCEPDMEDEVSTISKVSAHNKSIHDPQVEINDPDDGYDRDIGVTKFQDNTQKEYDYVTNEDFKVNKTGWREREERPWRETLNDIFGPNYNYDDDEEEDDE